MVRFLLPLMLLALLPGCKQKQYTPKNHKGSQIVAGSSGGVTGMLKEYILLDNGQLFLSKGLKGEWKAIGKLKRTVARDLFKKAEALDLGGKRFSHPGNMTYYLMLKDPSRTYEVKWGEAGLAPPDGIESFYNELITAFNR